MTRLLPFLFAEVCLCAAAADRLPPLSVCEAVAKRGEYAGRIVAVRGAVIAGGHGPYLVPSGPCSYELVTRGVTWPNIINLVLPGNRSPDLTVHAPFKPDWKAIQAAEDYLVRTGFQSGVDTETATYLGLFVTYADLDKRVSPGVPGALRLGFGPTGLGAPAQLVFRTVRYVSVVRGVTASPK
jgi:hypothetical protein